MPVCAECGMTVDKAMTYHPYAACLMFKACQSSGAVQANLDDVVFHGMQSGSKDALRYRWLRDVGDATWRPFALREGYSAEMANEAIDAAMLIDYPGTNAA